MVRAERTDTVEHLDLAALAHRRNPADETGDDLLLALLGDGEVDGRGARLDAEVGAVLDVTLDRRGLEKRLGRDASPVQTGTTERVLLDQGDLETGRGGVERSGVAARPATDDDDIERITHPLHRIAPTRG